ncbi:pyoverdine biosynthesis protein PvcA [Legionella lansingensis]|uniref:Pyoverdine biosynthesis protein PvcA n=1 Tax=Legionella lansingensis TaxID=45067 RepID=A0A0W0VPA0_9GAMM|nr:isocyanide synthase family protein [Legionella lansingensis]KTD21956.1 pyoverdine biosynthesis protein PvcA [Legionella lansingensis]SNV46108.1 pyoverdine biosynthesis protein PvcA [Legionella lansingensis]
MDTTIIDKAQKILALLFTNVRQAESNRLFSTHVHGFPCSHCQQPHLKRLLNLIEKKEMITLILPAFPAKSANRQKTLSSDPDLGEIMSLNRLNELCRSINQLHQTGVKLIICSDGRVFNDLVLVSDEEVNRYQQGIKQIIAQQKLRFLAVFSLDDVYETQNYQLMRNQLMAAYGESLSSLKQRLILDNHALYQFNGIHRFVVEDQLALNEHLSKNQIRRLAKETAYEVVRRSNAWSRLLAEHFPAALRLSIHPQPCGSDKLGIQFLPAANRWATPWHNVLLKKGDSWELIKRKEAERLGAKLNHDHYVLEGLNG